MKDFTGALRASLPAKDADEAEVLLRAIIRQVNKTFAHLEVEIKIDGIYEHQTR